MPEKNISTEMTGDTTIRACLLFICFVLGVYSLHATQSLLAPFALAVFIWLVIDTFARWIDSLSNKVPYWMALTIALFVVFVSFVGVILIIANTSESVFAKSDDYADRLTEIFGGFSNMLSKSEWVKNNLDLSSQGLTERFDLSGKIQTVLTWILDAARSMVSSFFVIAMYVAFLFAAQSSFANRVDDLWPDINNRARITKILERIRVSVEKYVGVQTLISLLLTVLSYAVMAAFGLDNALFWAMVIFILNYIPIVGGILAVAFPVLFGVVDLSFSSLLGMTGILVVIQFVINNTIQPKMMGDSMNMSSLVVVLALTVWTALWGGVGAFLSAPLTVIAMIIMAQFKSTRWISILLSADGKPDMDSNEKLAADAKPGM